MDSISCSAADTAGNAAAAALCILSGRIVPAECVDQPKPQTSPQAAEFEARAAGIRADIERLAAVRARCVAWLSQTGAVERPAVRISLLALFCRCFLVSQWPTDPLNCSAGWPPSPPALTNAAPPPGLTCSPTMRCAPRLRGCGASRRRCWRRAPPGRRLWQTRKSS